MKKTSIALLAGLMIVTGSAAMAEEYLETTGNRNAQSTQGYVLQDRAPAGQRTVREDGVRGFFNQAPSIFSAPSNGSYEQFPKVDPQVGAGG